MAVQPSTRSSPIADEEGNLVPVDETVGVMDTEGNITIAEATAD